VPIGVRRDAGVSVPEPFGTISPRRIAVCGRDGAPGGGVGALAARGSGELRIGPFARHGGPGSPPPGRSCVRDVAIEQAAAHRPSHCQGHLEKILNFGFGGP